MNLFRDYRKSVLPVFEHSVFLRIITTPPSDFDAKEASRKAAEKLLEQGLDVIEFPPAPALLPHPFPE